MIPVDPRRVISEFCAAVSLPIAFLAAVSKIILPASSVQFVFLLGNLSISFPVLLLKLYLIMHAHASMQESWAMFIGANFCCHSGAVVASPSINEIWEMTCLPGACIQHRKMGLHGLALMDIGVQGGTRQQAWSTLLCATPTPMVDTAVSNAQQLQHHITDWGHQLHATSLMPLILALSQAPPGLLLDGILTHSSIHLSIDRS